MGILSRIKAALTNFIKKFGIKEPLKKQAVIESLEHYISSLKDMVNIFSVISDKELMLLTQKYNSCASSTELEEIRQLLPTIKSLMEPKVKMMEDKAYFSTCKLASGYYLQVVEEIFDKIDTIMPDEEVEVHKLAVSNIALVGLLKEIDIFLNMFTYLWDHYTKSISNKEITNFSSPYRYKYVQANYPSYVTSLNNIILQGKNYSFINDVTVLRQSQNDFTLINGNRDFTASFDMNRVPLSIPVNVEKGMFGFGIVGTIQRVFNAMSAAKNQKRKAFRSFLESTLALLKLELNNSDPNSPEYIRLTKLIENYENELALIDKKINEYENS